LHCKTHKKKTFYFIHVTLRDKYFAEKGEATC